MGAKTVSLLEADTCGVAAVVVLFHPEIATLRRLYDSIRAQVSAVWFVDNTPGSAGPQYQPQPGEAAWEVIYRPLGANQGIAHAQNVGMAASFAEGCDHVLLLDQDSMLPSGIVAKLLAAEARLIQQGSPVAAVGSVFVDRKTGLPGKIHHHSWLRMRKPFVDLQAVEPLETDWLIASGSLIRRSVVEQVGTMREELFIDTVDMEWGLRARSQGLRSFVVPTAQITHSVGDSFARLLGTRIIVHTETRNYYIARNWFYLLRVKTMGMRWRSGALPHLAKFLLAHIWLAQDRRRAAMLFGRALWDAARGRMGRRES